MYSCLIDSIVSIGSSVCVHVHKAVCHTAVPKFRYLVLQGRGAQKGHLVARITVTSSIFNFSTRFFAQIVENRETQLSSPFLGPGDNFRKVMTKTRSGAPPRARRARDPGGFNPHDHASDPTRAV
jgi:hypothetical protein